MKKIKRLIKTITQTNVFFTPTDRAKKITVRFFIKTWIEIQFVSVEESGAYIILWCYLQTSIEWKTTCVQVNCFTATVLHNNGSTSSPLGVNVKKNFHGYILIPSQQFYMSQIFIFNIFYSFFSSHFYPWSCKDYIYCHTFG